MIELISLCQAAGFSLDEAAGVVSSADAAARRSLASAKLDEVDARIRELEEVRAVLAHFTRCQHGSGESEECARSVRAARARIVRSRDAGQR